VLDVVSVPAAKNVKNYPTSSNKVYCYGFYSPFKLSNPFSYKAVKIFFLDYLCSLIF